MQRVRDREGFRSLTEFYDIVCNGDDDREAWLKHRWKLITASEVPAILGVVPGATKIWLEKKRWIERKELEDPGYLEMGHVMEPLVAELYSKKSGRKVRRCQYLMRSKQYPWLGATLDYEILDVDGKPIVGPLPPLELKTTGKGDNWPAKGEPHLKYQIQLQTQMIVVGSSWGGLSAVIGSPFFHHRFGDFRRDKGLSALIVRKTKEFYDSLAGDKMPEFPSDNTTSSKDAIDALDVMAGSAVTLPDEAVVWTKELQETKDQISSLKGTVNELENRLAEAIGQHERGLLPDGSGSWDYSKYKRKSYTVKEAEIRQLKLKNNYGK